MKRLILSVTILAFTCAVQAAITCSTGGLKGVYHSEFKSISDACSEKVELHEKNTKGSGDNLDDLEQGRSPCGWVQSDVLAKDVNINNNPLAGEENLKVLMVLHNEALHLIVKPGIIVGKNVVGMGGRPAKSLADLKGLTVGSFGGSVTTAEIINKPEWQFHIKEYDDNAGAIAGLTKGDVQAVLAVVGQQAPWIAELKGLQFLAINGDEGAKVGKFYVPETLNYRNMGGTGVPTVAVQTLLMVGNVRTPTRLKELSVLKNCIVENLPEFQAGGDHHIKWRDVKLNAQTTRSFYETLPPEKLTATPVVTAPTPVKKK